MHRSRIQTLALSFLALAPVLVGQPPAHPRTPQGIYAVINIYEYTEQYQKIQSPQMTLEQYLMEQYRDVLQNPAVSGLAIWVKWSLVNPPCRRRRQCLRLALDRRCIHRGRFVEQPKSRQAS
jgi:hypothetical protein